MKALKLLLIGTIVLIALAGCERDAEEPVEQNQDNSENIDDNQSSDDNENSDDEQNTDDDQNSDDNQDDGQNLDDDCNSDDNDEAAYITLSPEKLSLPNIESTTTVIVESNYDWDYSYDSSNGWLTVEKNEGDSSLSVICSKNETGGDREGIVVVVAGDGDKNVAEAELKITQSWENLDALVLEYTITGNNVSVWLPIYDVSNAIIDWDDGTIETTSSNNRSHKYTTPGIYTVTINGDVKGLKVYNTDGGGSEYLTAVKQWGNTGLTSMYEAFHGCYGLSSLPVETGDAFADVTTFVGAFYCCYSLESIPSDFFSKCSKVESFRRCFYNCYSLSSVPEDLFSECLATTNFSYCFYGCTALVSAPTFKGCSEVTTFEETFYKCTALATVPENMFAGCAKVTNFSYVFYNCSSLEARLSELFDDSFSLLVTNFNDAFYGCSLVEGESPYTEVEINGENVRVHFYERSNYAVDMRWANPTGLSCFRGCTNLTDYDEIPSCWK